MKRRSWVSLIFVLVLLFVLSIVSPTSAASPIYVRTDGDDTNCNGTANVAYSASVAPNCAVKTIQKGIDIVDASGTVIVSPGEYEENVVILNKNVTLLSSGGRELTTIKGKSGVGSLATILVDGTTSGVQIGNSGQGFKIIGIDNGNPGVENAALYFRGTHSGAVIKDNEIVANGDHGLLSEYGATITNFTIDSNIFSGQTFVGSQPGGDGFANQFTELNVPRQLVVMGGGSSGTLTTNITFTNNQIIGTAGGINSSGNEQGNTLVTIDASNSLIQGNTFAGITTRYATSLRCRRPSTTIAGNTFISTGLTPTTGHLYLQNNALDSSLISANSFDKGVYIESSLGGFVGIGINSFVQSAPANSTVKVLSGSYTENNGIQITRALTIQGSGSNDTIVNGSFEVQANNVTIEGFHILTGTNKIVGDLHGIYVEGGKSGVIVKNNRLTGSWTGGISNFVGGRGILAGYNVGSLTVENNLIEKWVSGLYLNPTSGAIVVQNNNIQNNWAGAGTDGQGNVRFENNFFQDNIEGIGASSVGATFIVKGNSFTGNQTGVKQYGGNLINASGNWWGSAAKTAVQGAVAGSVDFTPWLAVGSDTSTNPGFQGDFSTLWVDDASPQSGTEGRIQEAIDLVDAGGEVWVLPGNYDEKATNRRLFNNNGPYQFGLFISQSKAGILVGGAEEDGSPIEDYNQVEANIKTYATNSFGYSGIFVEADNVTLQGLRIKDNIVGGNPINNKTIEIIGDNFTLRYCHVNVGSGEEDGGSIYFNDWRFDTNTNTSHVQSYTVESNWIDNGTSIDLASGAGFSGNVSGRKIINNKFTNDGDEYWPFISFSGSDTGVPWFVHSVGGAVIEGNDFNYQYNGDSYNGVGIAFIRARGTYENSQFDWQSFWENNLFNKAVVFGPNPPSELGTYSYTSGSYVFNNVRRIGVEIATEVKQAGNNHIVLAKEGTYIHPVLVNKPLTITSEEGWQNTIVKSGFDIYANNVTIDGFHIMTGTTSVGVDLHGIYVAAGSSITITNNVLTGSWTGGTNNFVGGRGILTSGNVNNLLVENNLIEKWVSGLYLNPTSGAIVVRNNDIQNNWAGAGTDGQGNVLFNNNNFLNNIEGIGASGVGSNFIVEQNAFSGNTDAVNWYSGNPIQAKLNWWSGNKGPKVSSNPRGNGQPISANVTYQPWLCDGTDTQPAKWGFQPNANADKCTNLATKLVFTQYPSSAFENIPFAQQPIVRAEDDDGNLAITYDNFIFLDISNNPVGGMLLPGPYYKKAVDGVATFSGLYINKAGQGYSLKAFGLGSSGYFILTEGAAFNVLKQQADLSISLTDNPDPINAGDPLTYTVTVSNNGPHAAQGVSVTLQLPAGVGFQTASGTGWTCVQSGGVVTCSRATSIGSGQTAAAITVQVTAPTQAGTITASASVALADSMDDPTPANNQASTTTTVVELPPTGPSFILYLPLVLNNAP